MGRRGFTALAGLLAVFGVTASVFYFVSQPKTLRLAVGPLGSEDARMAAGFVQGLNREKSSLRIRLVLTEGSEESAKKLDDGLADLAIVRPDIALPAQGDTALITRRSFPFIITTKASGIGRIADLRGRRIGVARNPAGNIVLLQRVLAQYEVRPSEVEIVGLTPDEIVPFVREGRIDAFFSINAVGSLANNDGINRLRSAWGEDPMLIPIREAEAIKARYRSIETGEIVRGALGGDPPRPSENLPTISVTSRLMASQNLDDNLVGQVVKELLALRLTLAAELPSIQGLETPSTDKDAPLSVHSGAAAFIDGEQETFFERYGDWFYLGVMGLSMLGTGGAAILGQESAARRRRAMSGLDELLALLPVIRTCSDEIELARLDRDADTILTRVLSDFAKGDLDGSGLAAYRLVMDQVGRAVAERRLALVDA
ncbi:TAXI family TRAP transporter solute-binding subunit [Bosea psychrotolerans]|uniref:TRAP transporter TAXI family solute receptor n=1 Tax=Bosea psychrotolerans TaxID=1871628 RepID=A0A2S4LUT7_9HYPH|nr:TAXI family TRAP transporter solute-binding subunit [Bosea psychrotolerans]POR46223.1 TRAP transporter TAXI family solute receptor [Bosea psychrotolerans]